MPVKHHHESPPALVGKINVPSHCGLLMLESLVFGKYICAILRSSYMEGKNLNGRPHANAFGLCMVRE